jgi:cell surface protein|nr:MAG TPA: leucine rich repeat protein [Caudoviricetes sp.]
MILFEKLLTKDANTYIRFSDENVELFCANFDKNNDSRLSYDEAASVTVNEFNSANYNSSKRLTLFDEFQFFTGLSDGVVNTQRFAFNNGGVITIPNIPISVNNLRCSTITVHNTLKGSISGSTLILKEKANVNVRTGSFQNYVVDENCERFCKVGDFILSKDKTRLLVSDLTKAQVVLPDTVQRVEDRAILNSTFTSIKVPNNVTYIGSHFSGTKMETVDIGENVEEIKHFFCYNSAKLKKVIFRGRVKSFYGGAFDWMYRFAPFTIYVRNEDIEYYKSLFKSPYNTYVKSIDEMK